MRKVVILSCAVVVASALCGCRTAGPDRQAARFIQGHVSQVEPLATRANQVYWDAATTGEAEKFKEFEEL